MKTYKELLERIDLAKAKMGDVIKDFQDSDAPQFKGKSQEKRREMAIAAKMAAEEVEQIEEAELEEKFVVVDKNKKIMHVHGTVDAANKKAQSKGLDPEEHVMTHNYWKREHGSLRNEEVEQIDELSQDKLMAYRSAAKKQGTGIQNRMKVGGGDWSKDGKDTKTLKKRLSGYKMAGRKVNPGLAASMGKAPRVSANEEVELEEGRMKEIAMDMSTLGDQEFKAKHRKSKQEMQSALRSSEELKGDQHKIDANKNGKIDGHDFKLLRSKKKVEESSDLKPFIVVHAKHGKHETHASSTYEAAKNAAAHWKTKKGTAGMDVYRADITHSTQHVG